VREAIVTLRDQGSDKPADRIGGIWRLDAERRWVVAGSPDAVQAVEDSLPGSCTTRIGPVLLLEFGNAVGFFDSPHLGRLEVRIGKWTQRDFDRMLEDITRITASLPFTAGETAGLPYDRSLARREDVLYHAFVYLRHAVTGKASGHPLLPALHTILSDPHRRLVRHERRVPLALAGHVEPSSALRAVTRCLDHAPADHSSPLATLLRGKLPRQIDESVTHPTFDVPENRFVKSFLDLSVGIVEEVRRRATEKGPASFAGRVARQCDEIERFLRPIQHHGMWSGVGQMRRFPAESTVLQRRRGYHDVLHHFVRLRLATRLPLSQEQAIDLLEIKNIATLYESWCFLQIVEGVRQAIGEDPMVAKLTDSSPWQTLLPRGAKVTWATGAEVHYNLSFSRSKPQQRRSYSLPLRPDVVLRVPCGPNIGIHALDAKFRLRKGTEGLFDEDNGQAASTFKVSDLHKMHTYRDALPAVRTSWVLYPGESFRFFDEHEGESRVLDRLPRKCRGVGILPLIPGTRHEHLTQALAALLDPAGAPARS